MTSTRTVLRFPRSSFHKRLELATRQVHHRLETRLPLLESGLTPERYRDVLRVFFGFYLPLEASLDSSAPPVLRATVACRSKSWWLLEDLMSLGDSTAVIGTLPLCQELPTITNQAEVLGSLYVVEGATLGGQIILKSLRGSLGPNADRFARFFTSYGVRVPDMWSQFLRILEAAAYDRLQEEAIIASARRTFSSFEQWLVLNHAADPPAAPYHSLALHAS
ncbi:MAG: hypothetical protein A4E19_19885 [Nitrospira sp. SG-bin1]|nr:MAG: hypothetical protein A4E19_19885 [Nitrospira sp. SG-bin1]